jgi:hypothetical protein
MWGDYGMKPFWHKMSLWQRVPCDTALSTRQYRPMQIYPDSLREAPLCAPAMYALIKYLTLTNRRHWTMKGKVIHTQPNQYSIVKKYARWLHQIILFKRLNAVNF